MNTQAIKAIAFQGVGSRYAAGFGANWLAALNPFIDPGEDTASFLQFLLLEDSPTPPPTASAQTSIPSVPVVVHPASPTLPKVKSSVNNATTAANNSTSQTRPADELKQLSDPVPDVLSLKSDEADPGDDTLSLEATWLANPINPAFTPINPLGGWQSSGGTLSNGSGGSASVTGANSYTLLEPEALANALQQARSMQGSVRIEVTDDTSLVLQFNNQKLSASFLTSDQPSTLQLAQALQAFQQRIQENNLPISQVSLNYQPRRSGHNTDPDNPSQNQDNQLDNPGR